MLPPGRVAGAVREQHDHRIAPGRSGRPQRVAEQFVRWTPTGSRSGGGPSGSSGSQIRRAASRYAAPDGVRRLSSSTSSSPSGARTTSSPAMCATAACGSPTRSRSRNGGAVEQPRWDDSRPQDPPLAVHVREERVQCGDPLREPVSEQPPLGGVQDARHRVERERQPARFPPELHALPGGARSHGLRERGQVRPVQRLDQVGVARPRQTRPVRRPHRGRAPRRYAGSAGTGTVSTRGATCRGSTSGAGGSYRPTVQSPRRATRTRGSTRGPQLDRLYGTAAPDFGPRVRMPRTPVRHRSCRMATRGSPPSTARSFASRRPTPTCTSRGAGCSSRIPTCRGRPSRRCARRSPRGSTGRRASGSGSRFRRCALPSLLGRRPRVRRREPRHRAGRPGRGLTLARFGQLTDSALSEPLDRAHPLWQVQLVPRLEDGRAGLIFKMHHALVDGKSAVELALLLFDLTPDPGPEPPSPWTPASPPSAARLALDAFYSNTLEPLRAARGVGRLAARPGEVGFTGTLRRAALAFEQDLLRSAPDSYLNRPIGPRRVLVRHRARMADIVDAKRRAGATVNDVCLAAVAGALRELAPLRGETPQPLKAMVPVSVRADDQRQDLGNRITFAFVELPVATRSRAGRLAHVRRETASFKQSGRAAGTGAMLRSARPAAGPGEEPRRAARVEFARLQPDGLQHPRTAVPALHARSRAERGISGGPDRRAALAGDRDVQLPGRTCSSGCTPTRETLPEVRGAARASWTGRDHRRSRGRGAAGDRPGTAHLRVARTPATGAS